MTFIEFVIKVANLLIGFVVNLFAVGCGMVLGAIVIMFFIVAVNAILFRISLRWCHKRVAHGPNMWPTREHLHGFTYKDVHNREIRVIVIYLIAFVAMVAPLVCLLFAGDPDQLKWYWGDIDKLHVMFSPISVYIGAIMMAMVLFVSNAVEQGTFHFDIVEKPEMKEPILILGSKGSYVGITLDAKGSFVNNV